MSNIIDKPNHWELKALNDVLEQMTDYVANGSFKSLRENVEVLDTPNFAYYIRLYDLRLGVGHGSQKYVDEKSYNFLKKSYLNGNEILIANIGANVGEVFLMPKVDRPATIAPNMILLRVNKNVDNKYLFYYLSSHIGQSVIGNEISGSGQPKLNKTGLKKVPVLLAPIDEQQKISEILTSVDETIEKTETIIEQTEKVKKGLMQQLFTKGIRHKKFKKTDIGTIPEEWEISSIKDIFLTIKSGISRRFDTEDIGYPVIRSANIDGNNLKLDELKYWYLEDDQGVDLKKFILDDGDILVNFINSLAQIGKCCLFVSQERDFIYTTNIFRIKADENKVINKYFYYFSQTYKYQAYINGIVKPAVNQASFTKEDFGNLKIPLPPLNEQKLIIETLSSIDDKITNEKNKVKYLSHIKKGLMQVLLTGKLRVIVDDEEVTIS